MEWYRPDWETHPLLRREHLSHPQRQGRGVVEPQRRSWCNATTGRSDLRGQPMKTTSRDGTTLSCAVAGKGSPLVLIHGAGNRAARWNPVIPLLEQTFAMYVLDRRGRGESGD